MTNRQSWLGLIGTVLIGLALVLAVLREPSRQIVAAETLHEAAIIEGTDLYAANCVICHGTTGEGLAAFPPLDNEAIRLMDEETLFRTIERGRYNTAMAAYSTDEGGIFTDMQINSLVTLIQSGVWDQVGVRVAELGLVPPTAAVVTVSDATLQSVAELPNGDTLTRGLTLYAEKCTACHGANGEGSALAPVLASEELRARLTDADLSRIVSQGVPGTLMAGWERALTADQITDLVALIRRWDELALAGIALPVVEAAPIDMSPAAIAAGQSLFGVVCAQCHGPQAFGTRLAPALNNATFLGQTSDSAIQQIIALGVTGTSMPAWGGYLTEADIAALTAYLRSLEPTAPASARPG